MLVELDLQLLERELLLVNLAQQHAVFLLQIRHLLPEKLIFLGLLNQLVLQCD